MKACGAGRLGTARFFGTLLLLWPGALHAAGSQQFEPALKGYVSYHVSGAPNVDGLLDDPAWKTAPWTDWFEDLEGSQRQWPRFKTRVKAIWDDEYFYVGAEMEEPHVWATMLKRDTAICLENDFEVFFDPDGDSHEYYELEINALNTVWDLLLKKPYRDGGPPVDSWDIDGLKTAVDIEGTLNDPRDVDKGWSVEIAFPWKALQEYARRPSPPRDGDQWRMGFFRVQWQVAAAGESYQKVPDTQPDNWAWSPHGVVDMHRPEAYGYVQFSRAPAGTATFVPDFTQTVRRVLYQVYYAEKAYFEKHRGWASSLEELNIAQHDEEGVGTPVITLLGDGYEATTLLTLPGERQERWHIRHDSRIWNEAFSGGHFLTDAGYRQTVERDFENRKAVAARRSHALFSVLESHLSKEEEEALKFLYAYMPLSDLADYDGEFFLNQVRTAFEARRTFRWGSKVPEDLFRHFVLPYRVNNENLDTARSYIFQSLKDRIKEMSMKDATLEVNHWCHERATYQSTDIRTSAPLAVINTGFGRCGEETTLLVTALRAVGIPARQCYTPRWAHSDDNHAWVEAWVDGRWSFLGGCEPESDLNMAWFKEPARRAMLVHTKAFGRYQGPEETTVQTEKYSEINLLSSYAPVKRLVARVLDAQRQPIADAHVEFQLYNYAEFFPLVSTLTDARGERAFTTGLGDLLVWAWKGEKYGYKKVTVEVTDTADVILDRVPGLRYGEELDFVPPIERPALPGEPHDAESNKRRLQTADKMRAEHAATFMDSPDAFKLATSAGLNADSVWMFIRKSRGNWNTMVRLITGAPPAAKRWVLPLLSSLAEKDLRDISYRALEDHLLYGFRTPPQHTEKVSSISYVLCPRVNNEILVPYRGHLQNGFSPAFVAQARKDPSELVRWVKDSVKVSESENWYHTPLTPRGVFDLRVADASSRDIFFVSSCRSLGIPARVEPASKQPQYFDGMEWQTVEFEEARASAPKRGRIILERKIAGGERRPVYWIQYTLARFDSGKYHTLDYDFGDSQAFPLSLDVAAGDYMLVAGNRLPDGTVLSNLSFFSVSPAESVRVKLDLRETAVPLKSRGKIDMKTSIDAAGSLTKMTLSEAAKGKGLLLAWIDPDNEPTKHALKDIQDLRETFETWGGGVVLLAPGEPSVPLSATGQPFVLPGQVLLGTSTLQSGLWRSLAKSMERQDYAELPVLVVADVQGDVYFLSEGYRIGVGEELAKMIARLKK